MMALAMVILSYIRSRIFRFEFGSCMIRTMAFMLFFTVSGVFFSFVRYGFFFSFKC